MASLTRPLSIPTMRTWPAWSRSSSSSSGPSPRLLLHQHLDGLVAYDAADALQDRWRATHLSHKARGADSDPPRPFLLSFEARPTYTLGRQQRALAPDEERLLRQPLIIPSRSGGSNGDGGETFTLDPEIKMTARGGLTTYHGPGQLVLWPVVDLHSPLHPRLSVSAYASLLESTTRTLLADLFGIRTFISRNEPGVWVEASSQHVSSVPRKIAALGVHHRRFVTAHGTAININTPVAGTDLRSNPWARFVPCGIVDKGVTSVAEELGQHHGFDLTDLACRWATIFEQALLDPARQPDSRK